MSTFLPEAKLDLTRDVKALIELAATDETLDQLLRRALDWLARIARYEVATIFLLENATLVARVSRGPLVNEKLKSHTLPLSQFPMLREAIETRRAKAFTEQDHQHGDAMDGVLNLPAGHACMVVPLFAGEKNYGLLTLDCAQCETYPAQVVELVEVYGHILSIAIQGAEQRILLQRLHRQDHEHAKLLEAELSGESADVFRLSESPAVQDLARRARQVAETQTPVLIMGETGTGKERLARAIHLWSSRADHPFVTLNCAAIPAGLLESELFGHVKGAFTGANRDRSGRFLMANGGTLLLDEIGELPLELQAKLLRALQEQTFEPVGSDRTVKADVRILAATHVDLPTAVVDKRFREDLFYRLSVFPLTLPPLRQRLEDIPRLCASILEEQERRTGRRQMRVDQEGILHLQKYRWPGNIRELANTLERACILSRNNVLTAADIDLPAPRPTALFSPARPNGSNFASGPNRTLDEVQRQHIQSVLETCAGRIYGKNGAAERLGLKPSTLQSRMKRLHLSRH